METRATDSEPSCAPPEALGEPPVPGRAEPTRVSALEAEESRKKRDSLPICWRFHLECRFQPPGP